MWKFTKIGFGAYSYLPPAESGGSGIPPSFPWVLSVRNLPTKSSQGSPYCRMTAVYPT
ncbi:unnamed protein product [Penicillium camemberti]|uniref:Str. FM013 n=1 Tax=Penicillium camemberti (strain FM 013) TaxID=1429867 RepID=A0A0G4PYR5_PENC3|nr:unnamed protein product [Penicillium camemberti]